MRWVVCGFYTPDYSHWGNALRCNLDQLDVRHDIRASAKLPGGWEANTRAKPIEIRAAMDRHPDTTIIFLDVDCAVRGPISRLQGLADIGGDVGIYARTRLRSSGKPLFAPRSGTIVLRPTPATRRFTGAWIDAGLSAHRYANDQDLFVVALGRVPRLSVTLLGNEACAILADRCLDPIVLHDTSDREKDSVSRLRKTVTAMVAKRRMIKVAAST